MEATCDRLEGLLVAKKQKLPAIQFYPGDWHKDQGVQCLTLEERGAWLEILFLMFESEQRGKLLLNGGAYPMSCLAISLRSSESKVCEIVEKLVQLGVCDRDEKTQILSCRRMLRDEKLRRKRASSGKQGGKQTSSKRQANVKQKGGSSSSSSISSSSSSSDSNPPGPLPAPPPNVPPGCTEAPPFPPPRVGRLTFHRAMLPMPDRLGESFVPTWNGWLDYLIERGDIVTQETAQLQLTLLARAGPVEAARMIERSKAKGWKSLDEGPKNGRNANKLGPGQVFDPNASATGF